MEKTILVIDDFRNTRQVISSTLVRAGYRVLEAENGREALKLFNGEHIDLIISDLNMPEMDGLAFAAEVRKMSFYRFTPILMLTTETNREKKQKAKEIGITGWIQKPFQVERFMKFVEKALK